MRFLLKILLSLFSVNLFASEDLLQCISKGKTMEACRTQTRMNKHLKKATQQKKIEDEERAKKLQEVTRNWETYFDPVKNVVMDKSTGKPIDLRNYSLIDREIILCQIRGGTWSGRACSGNVLAVAEESKKLKTTTYIEDSYKNLKRDPKVWAQVTSQLEQKEQMRLELKNARMLYRKLLKYGMNAIPHESYYYVLEANGELVPIDQYAQTVAYQEAIAQGKSAEEAEKIAYAPAAETPAVEPTNSATPTVTAGAGEDAKMEKLNAIITQLQLSDEEIQEVYDLIETGQYSIEQAIEMLQQSSAPATK
jgi:hypothetical protein